MRSIITLNTIVNIASLHSEDWMPASAGMTLTGARDEPEEFLERLVVLVPPPRKTFRLQQADFKYEYDYAE